MKGVDEMKKNIVMRISTLALCIGLFFSAIPVRAAEDIKPSQKEYDIEISEAGRMFFGNEKKVEFKVGQKYFLTYTVDKVKKDETVQSGAVVTTEPNQNFPYMSGNMHYDTKSLLMDEGYTYFFRFEVTEDGMRYIVAKAKDNTNSYVQLPTNFGGADPQTGYFGVWTGEGGNLTASLSHVRCYDDKGNDLGVFGSSSRGVMVIGDGMLDPNEGLKHSYEFSLKGASTVAISNSRRTSSNVVYFEYTVKNLNPEGVTQSGVINTTVPTGKYPHGVSRGLLKWNYSAKPEDCMMLTEGASYVVRFEKKDGDFSTMIKRIVDGKEDYISCTGLDGEFTDGGYYALWFGEACKLSADFENVKCYDGDGNNLAIQTNQGIGILHHGNLEDYSECEAVYYCIKNDTFVSLDDECNASKWKDGDASAVAGTYYINASKLYLTTGNQTEEFDYVFESFTDASENKYLRLRDVKVTFVSGVMGGDKLEQVTVTSKDGYKVTEPAKPTKKNNTFKGWCLGDGTEYNFDSVVTESITLYAKWQDGNGNEYLATSNPNGLMATPVLVIGISSVIVLGTAVAGVMIVKRRK